MIPLPATGLLDKLSHRTVKADGRRPFREPGWRSETFLVHSGVLALYRYDGRSHRRQIVALRFGGEIILPQSGDYGIEAMVPTEVAIISDDLASRPDLGTALFLATQRDVAIAHEWLVSMSRDCSARVAHLLCETAVRGGYGTSKMQLPFTQQQIADVTGQTSVNVNRVLMELEDCELIKRNGRELEFLDWDGLRRMAGFTPAYLEAA